MKKNMGIADRVIRLILAAIFVVLYFTGVIGGTLGIVLITLSALLFLTSLVSVCPMYFPFGFNTMQKKLSTKS